MLKTTLCGVIIAISQAIRPALAWEDHVVLDAITRANPIIQAQQDLVSQHHVPGALQAVLDNTHFVARLGGVMTPLIAADDVVAAGSSKTAGVTAFGGIQMRIPVSSTEERQAMAAKQVDLAKSVDSIRSSVLNDIAQLRGYEADLKAAEVRMGFYRDQAEWLKKRMEEGFSEMEKLWAIGGKLNDEKASVERLSLLASSQRHKLSQYAGDHWQGLMSYLEGKSRVPFDAPRGRP